MRYRPTLTATVLILTGVLGARGADAPNEKGVDLIKNGGAEQARRDQPAGWDVAAVPASGLKLSRDLNNFKSGKASFLIENTHTYDPPVANNWRQEIMPLPDVGTTLQITAFMKTADVDDVANVCVQCWDADGKNMLAFGSTAPMKGDNDWTAVKSEAIRVPRGTKSVVVRAALRGKGKVWFDEIGLKLVPSAAGASAAPRAAAPDAPISPQDLEQALIKCVDGKVVEVLPVDRDQMILAYLPDWAHGKVDNIAVANNDGGVRTLFGWPAIDPAKHADARFLLALYAREVVHKAQAGAIGAYEVQGDWDEQTSWSHQPRTADQFAAQFTLEKDKGWKVFDITKLAKSTNGVMLRFAEENQTSDTWSGYAFVSREGDGEWAGKHPLLLIVQ